MNKTQLSSSEIQDLINKYKSEQKKLEYQVQEVSYTIEQLDDLLKSVIGREQNAHSTLIKQNRRTKKVKLTNTSKASPKVETSKVTAKKGRAKKGISTLTIKPTAEAKSVKENPTVKIKRGRNKIEKIEAPKKNKKATENENKSLKKTVTAVVKSKESTKQKLKPIKVVSVKSTPKLVSNKKTKSPEKSGYKLSEWDVLVIDSIAEKNKVLITQEIIDYVKIKMQQKGKPITEDDAKNKVTRSLQKLANRRGDLKKVDFKGKGFAYALPNWMDTKGKLVKSFIR